MVVALVLLPALGGALGGAGTGGASSWGSVAFALGLTLVKVAAFVAVMLVAGRRLVPWLMHYAARTGSRELFRLSVYAVALGVAYGAAALFGVSFALGAFFAGMVLAESPLSQRATEEAMPLRDAFAVLFFVSVGMLFNPGVHADRRVLLHPRWPGGCHGRAAPGGKRPHPRRRHHFHPAEPDDFRRRRAPPHADSVCARCGGP